MSSLHNPYQYMPKQSDYQSASPNQSSSGGNHPLATVGQRLLGAIADSLVGFLAMTPGFILLMVGAAQESTPLILAGFALSAIASLVLLITNIYLLATRSQSIGKYIIKTQIVDYESRQPASFVSTFVLRGIVSGLLGVVPFFGIIDALFVFGEERRCIHDLIASTSVVDIS